MASRTVKRLYDLEIDEISLVDRSANQHADVAIAKRDEGTMTLMDVDGYEVAEDELQPGDVVYDAETGEELVACEEGAEPSDYFPGSDEGDEVGKGASWGALKASATQAGKGFNAGRKGGTPVSWADDGFKRGAKAGKFAANRRNQVIAGGTAAAGGGAYAMSKSLGEEVYEELSKSLGNDQRDQVISKALNDAQQEVREARREAAEAQEIAKNLQDQSELEYYFEIAKGYGLPGDPEEIAHLLKSTADAQGYEAVEKMHTMFSAAGEQLFEVYGSDLGPQESSVMGQIEALASQAVTKADVSEAQAVVELFSANPDAYEAYLAETR